ncbi:MAG: HAMP domain-containing histidine kinase, partial [Campylobacter sp.]|nr:HAMP domain-containing histidine kinase [Campylobacter sp.]
TTNIGSAAIIIYNKHHFIKIKQADKEILLQDNDYQPYRYDIIKVVFVFVFIVILITYIFIIRKIKPLRKLKRQINKFAAGDLNIKNISTGKDEISDVASAFYEAVMQIKRLNDSRALFLRNIMHELKTPITKGRITVEMIEKNKYQERLIDVFEKLEELINEFAAVERATAGMEISQMSRVYISEIIDEAMKTAMVEEKVVECYIEDSEIYADFKLMSIAIKNIIDNATKYSDDNKVKIYTQNNSLEFYTLGEPMQQELECFIQPFTKGEDASQSFGLGLYIVNSIIKSHSLNFAHRYENGYNVFIFAGLDKIKVKDKDMPALDKIDQI